MKVMHTQQSKNRAKVNDGECKVMHAQQSKTRAKVNDGEWK